MPHTLSLCCPDAGDFLAWWPQAANSASHTVQHFVWQCRQAPRWAELQSAICRQLPQAQAGALCAELAPQWWGLIPGWHRLPLQQERIVLQLAIGPALQVAQECTGAFGQIMLHAGSWQQEPQRLAAAVSSLARQGTGLHLGQGAKGGAQLQDALRAKGWQPERPAAASHAAPDADSYFYNPHWKKNNSRSGIILEKQRHALIIGAGLSGAACAFSLARRGWQVTVADQAAAPASGASGLPVGLIVPHSSADDTRISQLTRAGIRCTLQRAAQLLQQGQDWAPSGVLEHCVEGKSKLARDWQQAEYALAADWSQPASAGHMHAGQLPEHSVALWHPHAAWVKPAQLVSALLAHPAIRFQGGVQAQALQPTSAGNWQLLDAAGKPLAEAALAIVASGFDSAALLAATLPQSAQVPLNALRGQVAWGWQDDTLALPATPVNGKGSLAAHIPHGTGRIWITGSTFTRGDTHADVRAADMPEILHKLAILHPAAAQAVAPDFAAGKAQGWAGVRATLPDRLPATGAWPLPPGLPPLLLCCGMGARGLSLAMLCGELLAAQLHQEPWPTERKLGQMLAASRWHGCIRPPAA